MYKTTAFSTSFGFALTISLKRLTRLKVGWFHGKDRGGQGSSALSDAIRALLTDRDKRVTFVREPRDLPAICARNH